MRFEVQQMTGKDDMARIAAAVGSVDPQAQVVVNTGARAIEVDSWLYPEEFLVAFYEAGYDARIERR